MTSRTRVPAETRIPRLLACGALACGLATGIAAPASGSEPLWTVELGDGARTPLATGAGIVLAPARGELIGIEASSGVILWRRPFDEALSRDRLRTIAGTPTFFLATLAAARRDGADGGTARDGAEGSAGRFQLVDARTGETVWLGRKGADLLDVYAEPDGRFALAVVARDAGARTVDLVRIDLAAEPGDGGEEADPVVWEAEGALFATPLLLPLHPGERSIAWTTDGSAGPLFAGDRLVTRWSAEEGVVARDRGTGTLAWRLVPPTTDPLPTAAGHADLQAFGDAILVLLGERQVGAVAATDGAPIWRRGSAGRAKAPVAHLVVGGGERGGAEVVVAAGGAWVQAFRASDGRRSWRLRVQGGVADLALEGRTAFVLDGLGAVRALDAASGAVRWSSAAEGLPGALLGLTIEGDAVAIRAAGGVSAIGAEDGRPLWRVEAEPAAGLGGRLAVAIRKSAVGVPGSGLTGEGADPLEHWWTAVESAGGVVQAVLHRTDLRTGSDVSVPLGSESPRWTLERGAGVAVVLEYGGTLRALAVGEPPPRD